MTRPHVLLGLVILAATLSGCAGSRASGTAAGGVQSLPYDSTAAESALADLVMRGLRVPGGGRAEVRAAFGEPDSVRAEVFENRHVPAQMDTIVEWFYPGLRLEYYVVSADSASDLLSVADVGDNRFLRFPELGVGADTVTVTRRLGAPRERNEHTLVYECGSCLEAYSPVEFHLANGRVRRVRFVFYVD